MQEPREFLGALFESVKTSMRTPIVLDIYGDAVDMIAARDAEWQARVDKLEAALDYAIACLPDAPLNAKEKLRAALGREA